MKSSLHFFFLFVYFSETLPLFSMAPLFYVLFSFVKFFILFFYNYEYSFFFFVAKLLLDGKIVMSYPIS